MLHGGEIYDKKIELDFSVNLNPNPCPEEVLSEITGAASKVSDYPDSMQRDFRLAVAEAESRLSGKRVRFGTGNIVGGNGASELLMAIVNMVGPKKALLPVPSFYGYEHALKAGGECEIVRFPLSKELELTEGFAEAITDDVDIVIVGNPNNPTGRLISENVLAKIMDRCIETGTVLVVDECFFRLADKREGSDSPVSARDYIHECPNLFVVDAYTKLFSIPGVRVGFTISSEENIEKLRGFLPEWNMSVFADHMGIRCAEIAGEGSFIRKSLDIIREEKGYLSQELSDLGIRVYPSETNFVLIQYDKDLYNRLLEHGILIRDCSNFEGLDHGYYRVAVRSHDLNMKLVRAIRSVLR